MHAQSRLLLAVVLTLVADLAMPAPARADRAMRLVSAWYQRYLDRLPDPAGFRDWTDQLRRGVDPLIVEAGILSSDEYWRRAGSNAVGWVDRPQDRRRVQSRHRRYPKRRRHDLTEVRGQLELFSKHR